MSDDDTREDLAPAEECAVDPEDEGDEDWSPFEEMQDEYKPRPIRKVTAADGLPTNFAPVPAVSDIPVLNTDTLICMADESKFVMRDGWGDILAMFDAAEVEQAPNGSWRTSLKVARERLASSTHPRADRQRLTFVRMRDDDWVALEPIRPACIHYVRQLTQFDLNAQAKMMVRACAARRTTEGAFMSLRDRAMWDCTMREPRVDVGLIDTFDREKVAQGEHREMVPMFPVIGGIFQSQTPAAGGENTDGG